MGGGSAIQGSVTNSPDHQTTRVRGSALPPWAIAQPLGVTEVGPAEGVVVPPAVGGLGSRSPMGSAQWGRHMFQPAKGSGEVQK